VEEGVSADERRRWWRSVVEIRSEAELMWCLHCELVARVDAARRWVDDGDEMWGCSDPKCDGAGPGIDLLPWELHETGFVPFVAGVNAGEYVRQYPT
jgi:hypothetical protein